MEQNIRFHSDLAAVIEPSKSFQELAIAAAEDINENDEEVLTLARSRLKLPPRIKIGLDEFTKSYLPKIFDGSFRPLFNPSEITAATEPRLYSCRKGTFTFQQSAVVSIFIIFRARSSIDITMEDKDDPTKSASIDEWGVPSFLIIPGKCAVKFHGEGKIILANITYRNDVGFQALYSKSMYPTASHLKEQQNYLLKHLTGFPEDRKISKKTSFVTNWLLLCAYDRVFAIIPGLSELEIGDFDYFKEEKILNNLFSLLQQSLLFPGNFTKTILEQSINHLEDILKKESIESTSLGLTARRPPKRPSPEPQELNAPKRQTIAASQSPGDS